MLGRSNTKTARLPPIRTRSSFLPEFTGALHGHLMIREFPRLPMAISRQLWNIFFNNPIHPKCDAGVQELDFQLRVVRPQHRSAILKNSPLGILVGKEFGTFQPNTSSSWARNSFCRCTMMGSSFLRVEGMIAEKIAGTKKFQPKEMIFLRCP
jgi:hypothetical protein